VADSNGPGRGCAWACVLAVAGCVVGLLLGGALGGLHVYLFWRSGGEGAGTEVILVPLYAIPGAVLGAAAGLIGGLWAARRR
jgi:hypothetical protein